MPRPWRIRYAGAKYHVTVRGNGRQSIFLNESDYQRFLTQLVAALERDQVILYAYVLMPNHYHLLVETPFGNVQRFMQRLNTAYSMHFRYKHRRPGHCLQGRYGAKLVSGDDYLVRLTRYIHLNPVKTQPMKVRPLAERQAHLTAFPWSSYRGYANKAMAKDYVNYRWLKLMGRATMEGNRRAYQRYVAAMVAGEDADLSAVKEANRYAIGDDRFQKQVEEDLRDVRENKGVHGDIRWPVGRRVPLARVEQAVHEAFGIATEQLRTHGRHAGVAKKVAIELCCQLSGQSQREVGRHFGYTGNGAIGKQRQKLREILSSDTALTRQIVRLREQLRKK